MGLGYIGRVHLAAARALGATLTAVATSRPERAGGTEGLAVFADYDEFLRQAPVDAVVLSVPTWLHERYAIDICRGGRHLLCEKPLALDAAAARRIVAAGEAAGVTLMAAQVLRFWPQYQAMRLAIQTGRIGRLMEIHAARLSAYPPWAHWFREPHKSGGVLMDLAVHDLDFLHSLMGAPRRVQCALAPSKNGTPAAAHAWLWFDSTLATVQASYALPASWRFRAEMHAVGDGGAMEYRLAAPANVAGRQCAEQICMLYPEAGEPVALPAAPEDPYQAQLRYFLACAERREAPLRCPPADSIAVLEVADACRRSAAAGATAIVVSENPQ